MPSTRRVFLAGALATAAGCSVPTRDGGTPTSTPTSSPTPPGTTATDTPEPESTTARWSDELPFPAAGTVSLAPGAGGPAVYVGSAAVELAPDDDPAHGLAAVSLADGRGHWWLSLSSPPLAPPTHGGDDGPPRLYVPVGHRSLDAGGTGLHVVDPTTGRPVWGFDVPELRFVQPLATGDGSVFVGLRDDQPASGGESIYALGASEGEQRWRIDAGDVAPHGHAVRRGTLVVKEHRRVRGLDPETGEVAWRALADGPIQGPTYGSQGERVFLGHDGEVHGLGVTDGVAQWRREFDFDVSAVTRPRGAMDTSVYVGDRAGRLLALSPLDGTTRWTYPVGRDPFVPTVARTSESLFVGGAGVHALDAVSGEARWSFTPAVDEPLDVQVGTVAVAVGEDRVWALDPTSGDVRWTYRAASGLGGVAVAGDLVFVADGGTIRALSGGADG